MSFWPKCVGSLGNYLSLWPICAMLYFLRKPPNLFLKILLVFFWDTKHMVQFNAFEFFGSFRFTMQQCELDIDNFLSGGSNFPHKKSFIKLPLAAQQHLEGNGNVEMDRGGKHFL